MKQTIAKPVLTVKDITIRVYDMLYFEHTSWQIRQGEQWVILGHNGAGKSMFAKALAGLLPLKHGEIISSKWTAYLSFETQQQTLAKENRMLDLISGIGVEGKEKTVKQFLGNHYKNFIYKNIFSVDTLLHQSLRSLSTGEMRKVFIIKSLLNNPGILILDEPYDGLDSRSQKILANLISALMKKITVIFITHQMDEIPEQTTQILVMKDCHIFLQGKKELILRKYFGKFQMNKKIESKKKANASKIKQQKILISMQGVTVRYHKKIILNNISWTVKKGENWAVLGPNGAGKTTLMHLITGDNQQSYTNDIFLFGEKKGSGISMWDIKEHIGIVSSDLMLKYDRQMNARDVILSGFFDTIGLYQKADNKQQHAADAIIKKFKLRHFTNKNYHRLSFGQKRLILIARALVKSPELLIADEPFHGMDQENRKRIFDVLNSIGNSGKTNIILITHKESEILPCITHKLVLEKEKQIRKLVNRF